LAGVFENSNRPAQSDPAAVALRCELGCGLTAAGWGGNA